MTKEEVIGKIQEILVEEFELEADRITPESRLYEDLELDSIDAVDLIVRLKPYVEGTIDPALFRGVKTVQGVAEVILPLLKHS